MSAVVTVAGARTVYPCHCIGFIHLCKRDRHFVVTAAASSPPAHTDTERR